MSPDEQRASDIRIWIVSLFFLLFIVAGGSFLAMYVTYPESTETAWYPVVGMALVAIPWVFWLLTFVYRCCIKGAGAGSGGPTAFSAKSSLGKQQAGGASQRSFRSQSLQGGKTEEQIEEGDSNEPEKPLATNT